MSVIDQAKLPYKREVIADGPGGRIIRITLEPGQQTPPHNHSLPVIGTVIKGHPFELSVQNGYRDLEPGSTFEQPPDTVHMVGNPSTATEDAVIEDFYPLGDLQMEMFPGFFDTPPDVIKIAIG